MNDTLDIETAYSKIKNIFNKKVLIVAGTGASMAVDPKFSMVSLAEENGNLFTSSRYKNLEAETSICKLLLEILNGFK